MFNFNLTISKEFYSSEYNKENYPLVFNPTVSNLKDLSKHFLVSEEKLLTKRQNGTLNSYLESQKKYEPILDKARNDYKTILTCYQKNSHSQLVTKNPNDIQTFELSKDLLMKLVKKSVFLLNENKGSTQMFSIKKESYHLEEAWNIATQRNDNNQLVIIKFDHLTLTPESPHFLGKGSYGFVQKIIDVSKGNFAALKLSHDNEEKQAQLNNITRAEFKKLNAFNKNGSRGLQSGAYELLNLDNQVGFLTKLYNKKSLVNAIDEIHFNGLKSIVATDLIVSLFQGLQHLHKQTIIHGDLKPANCFVNIEENKKGDKIIEVAIGDIGGACKKSQLRSSYKRNHFGTPYTAGYFTAEDELILKKLSSSEEFNKWFEANQKRDIYALAVCAWYLITKNRPFEKSSGEAVYPITGKPNNYNKVKFILGDNSANVLVKALSEKPEDRPSIGEILSSLNQKQFFDSKALPKPSLPLVFPLQLPQISPSKTQVLSPSPIQSPYKTPSATKKLSSSYFNTPSKTQISPSKTQVLTPSTIQSPCKNPSATKKLSSSYFNTPSKTQISPSKTQVLTPSTIQSPCKTPSATKKLSSSYFNTPSRTSVLTTRITKTPTKIIPPRIDNFQLDAQLKLYSPISKKQTCYKKKEAKTI